MFTSDKQSGRSRVNWKSDSKKTKKTHVQHQQKKETGKDKLFQLQKQHLQDGMNHLKYKEYIQEKINHNKFYYRKLSEKDVTQLCERYNQLIQNQKNRRNEKINQNEEYQKKRKMFREKKRNMVYKQKKEMIQTFLERVSKGDIMGVSKNAYLLSSEPKDWNNTKKCIFLGGRYIEKSDRDTWIEIYRKINSPVCAHLFDLHSDHELNQFVYNY